MSREIKENVDLLVNLEKKGSKEVKVSKETWEKKVIEEFLVH